MKPSELLDLEAKVNDILKDDNAERFNLMEGATALFLNGKKDQEFIIHRDDLEKIEKVLDRKFGGICIWKGFAMSFVNKE